MLTYLLIIRYRLTFLAQPVVLEYEFQTEWGDYFQLKKSDFYVIESLARNNN